MKTLVPFETENQKSIDIVKIVRHGYLQSNQREFFARLHYCSTLLELRTTRLVFGDERFFAIEVDNPRGLVDQWRCKHQPVHRAARHRSEFLRFDDDSMNDAKRRLIGRADPERRPFLDKFVQVEFGGGFTDNHGYFVPVLRRDRFGASYRNNA